MKKPIIVIKRLDCSQIVFINLQIFLLKLLVLRNYNKISKSCLSGFIETISTINNY